MKTGLAFLTLFVVTSTVQAAESSWLTNYGDAMELARTTARPLLLVISHDDLFPVSTGQPAQPSHDLLDAYVLCRIDANSAYGKRVAEAFHATELPHSVIIDKTTKKILYRKAGRATNDAWNATLTKYQSEATSPQVFVTQPQPTIQSRSRANRPTYYSRQPVTSNFRQSAPYSFRQSAPFSFRQPAFCDT